MTTALEEQMNFAQQFLTEAQQIIENLNVDDI